MKKLARQIIFYGALIGIWALVAKLRIWPPYLFPPPWGVAQALHDGFADHSFWIGIAVTMKRMLIGYSLSVGAGDDFGAGRFKQQVSGRDVGRIAGEPAITAKHLLDPAGGVVVWADGESDSVCGADGVAACR